MKTILHSRGINPDITWSKAESKHYWNMALRWETDSMGSNLHLTLKRYNRILHKWWMKWLLGDLRLFEDKWKELEQCPYCDSNFTWDHLILSCAGIYGVTETRENLRNTYLTELELNKLSLLIHKRWNKILLKNEQSGT